MGTKISALPAGVPAAGDVFPFVQGGVTKKGTFAGTTLFTPAFASAGISANFTQTGTGPIITLFGTSTTPKSLEFEILTGGARGTATVRVSDDAGSTWFMPGSTIPADGKLTLTGAGAGLIAYFNAGTYVLGEIYTEDWQYTAASLGTGGAVAGSYKQVGDTLEVTVYAALGAGFTFGTSWLVPLPGGFTPDTSKMPNISVAGVPVFAFRSLVYEMGVIGPDDLLRADPLGVLATLPAGPVSLLFRIPVL